MIIVYSVLPLCVHNCPWQLLIKKSDDDDDDDQWSFLHTTTCCRLNLECTAWNKHDPILHMRWGDVTELSIKLRRRIGGIFSVIKEWVKLR